MLKTLADSLKLGTLHIKNRIVMASMTRMRADKPDGIPNDLMAKYYGERSGCGLILTEAAAVCAEGRSFPGAGDLFTKQQAEGWKKVIGAVHKRGTGIFIQLVHGGRASHKILNGGLEVYGPSPIAQRTKIHGTQFDYPVPKELTLEGIQRVKEQFLNSFKLAKQAGFDGIHIHSANGYLLDEFIKSCSNVRTDKYGGSVENRTRLALEVVDIATSIFPSERVSIKLSPTGRYGDMFDENPIETYTHLLKQLDKRKVGSVEITRSEGQAPLYGYKPAKQQIPDTISTFRPHFSGLLIGNQAYTREQALQDINKKNVDLVSFARIALSNPDFAERLINNWQINTQYDYKTFYFGGAKGYTDYEHYSAK